MSEQHKLTAEERVRDGLDYAVGPLEDRMVNGWLVALLMEEHAAQEVAEVTKERDEALAAVTAAHAILRRLIDANGEQNYGIVAAARKLLGMPESRLNPDPDCEHYHE